MTATTHPPPQSKTSVEHIDTVSVIDKVEKAHNNGNVDKFGAAEKTDPKEIALVRKLDTYMMVCITEKSPLSPANKFSRFSGSCTFVSIIQFLLPAYFSRCIVNFLDRNAIVNGKINDLDEDLGLVGTQYNTCVSIFFVG